MSITIRPMDSHGAKRIEGSERTDTITVRSTAPGHIGERGDSYVRSETDGTKWRVLEDEHVTRR